MVGVTLGSARITGWGAAMPDKVVTNVDLEGTLDTSDEWIIERTGIRERRVGGTTTGLAIEASERAMQRAGVTGRRHRPRAAVHLHPRRGDAGVGQRGAAGPRASRAAPST